MNNVRRRQIYDATAKLEEIKDILEDILNDEIDSFNNMPEGLQCSDNGITSEEAQENLESAIDSLYDTIISLEEI